MPNKDGGYLLPETVDPPRIPICIEIPNDPEHIRAFWGAVYELTWTKNWHNDDSHTAALVSRVWSDVYRKAYDSYLNGGCGEEKCKGYTPEAGFITWFPESPYTPNDVVPDGYTYHPWTIVDNTIIGTIISVWGLGFQVGDVYTDFTKLPAMSSWIDIFANLGNMPSFTVGGISGTGTVKLHLLNIPQGGRLLIQVDGAFNPLNLQLVELNKDLVSVPQETQTPFVVEVEITSGGPHAVKCTFLPTVDDTFIPIFFGGGLRSIELCGFGVTAMADNQCCDEGDKISYAVYHLEQIKYQQYLKMMDDGDTAASFNAPATFDGDASPERNYALCRTLNRLIQSTFNDAALAVGAASDVISTINRVFPSAQPISGIVSIAAHVIGDVHLKQLAQDCTAIRAVSCCMRDALTGQDTTIANLKGALGGCGFDFGTHESEIAAMVNNMLQNTDNARAFIAAMDDDFQSSGEDGGANAGDCDCECCEDGAEIVDARGKGNVLTYMGNCIWKSVQPVPVYELPAIEIPRYYHSVGDLLGRCIDVQPPPAGSGFYETHVSDHFTHQCNGTESGTVGGWGGEVIWGEWRGEDTQYYQIKLVE